MPRPTTEPDVIIIDSSDDEVEQVINVKLIRRLRKVSWLCVLMLFALSRLSSIRRINNYVKRSLLKTRFVHHPVSHTLERLSKPEAGNQITYGSSEEFLE